MKFQPKRFVVEVKRGTSRASFASPDTVSEKFSSAESTLFGASQKSVPANSVAVAQTAGKPPGRILESLIEPPVPVVPDAPERPRRGRKPGSKNKPKLPQIMAASTAAAHVTPAPLRKSTTSVVGSGFGEDGPRWRDYGAPSASPLMTPSGPEPAPAGAAPAEQAADSGQMRRSRLRDRSTILKRYVLGLEPRPGQSGSLRARKLARAAR